MSEKKLSDYFENADVKFVKSAEFLSQCPQNDASEFALFGRSNVGKSSFINLILGEKTLAKVSQTPGKTRLMNFFSLNESLCFVDLPGYGYAKVSKTKQACLSEIIKNYCKKRENLSGVIWLLDYRRESGTDADKEAAFFLSDLQIPIFVVLTKSDKLTKNERTKNLKSIKQIYQISDETPIIATSVLKPNDRWDFWELFSKWVK
ncbi:MAG: ribosome biogenesis GTP-binding protein YihA/YsxC [Chitinispirillales bacterium]|jgi:GTP-binding protein|nr:ribosome biogenesis GTP-binding protein YihA/YsxC [Chitinispirillales bacterium]